MLCVRKEIITINQGLRIRFLSKKYLLKKSAKYTHAVRGKLFTVWLIFYIYFNFHKLVSQYLTFQIRKLRFGDTEQFVLYYAWVMTGFKSSVCLKALWSQFDPTTLKQRLSFLLAPSKGEMRGGKGLNVIQVMTAGTFKTRMNPEICHSVAVHFFNPSKST